MQLITYQVAEHPIQRPCVITLWLFDQRHWAQACLRSFPLSPSSKIRTHRWLIQLLRDLGYQLCSSAFLS